MTRCPDCGCEHDVTADKLNDRMDIDHVIRVGIGGAVSDPEGVHAPELVMETADDFQILDEHERDFTEQAARQGWQLLTGWTGQDRYSGLIMHPSEYVGGALAQHILDTPGDYVVVTVECDQDSEPAGWAIAYRDNTDPAGPCWNGFCILGAHPGDGHGDPTGHTWTQRRGTVYCPACGDYRHAAGVCPRGYDSPVVSIHERGEAGEYQVTNFLAQDQPSYGPNADGNPYAQHTPEHRVWAKAQEHGRNAAAWVVDGNTSAVSARGLLKGIEDGDPAVMDSIREPSLSGEYGDDYSEDDLMADVGWVPHDGTDMRDELAAQYNTEVSTAFWHEVERLARNAIPEPDAPEDDSALD